MSSRLDHRPKKEKTDTLQNKGNWDVIKAKLKQQYAELTDADLTYTTGHEDEWLDRLERRLGKSRLEIVRLVDEASG